jgi:hypothetical protein
MPIADVVRQRVHPLITSNRTLVYSFLSTLAVSVAIGNALRNHSNFYSVAVYLSKSSRSLLVGHRYWLCTLCWLTPLRFVEDFSELRVLACLA